MKSSNLSKYCHIVYFFIFINCVNAEESVDIWKKENINKKPSDQIIIDDKESSNKKISSEKINNSQEIQVINQMVGLDETKTLFGVFDPEENNYTLDMWSNTHGKEIKTVIKRINKIKLSSIAEELFINTILTYAHLPRNNMTEQEFLKLKMNWLINNGKDDLIEEFLNKNKNFYYKEKAIQYLVDQNIANANLKDGCKKSQFISKEIKDQYLEKFKIYCLIFNNKKNEAQLLFDILREEGMSDSFFDSKINILLNIDKNENNKIKDDNLLNFYLSSITVKDFNYEPNEKTNKFIWQYLNAANLIKIDNIENKEKIQKLELAANEGTFDKLKIFEAYKKFSFDVSSLINAVDVYQSLETIESRALVYQKILLSDNTENKIKLVFLLQDLFTKDKLPKVFVKHMSDILEEIDPKDIPESYQEIVSRNIISDEEYKLGKIKYNDKVLHKSRVLRYYTEKGTTKQKAQKDLLSVNKKIRKNKNYFFSAKDLALIESFKKDGFSIPKEIKLKEIAERYNVPDNLLSLAKTKESGLLALKFVEIIGEDEVENLDPETVYFIIHILNESDLKKLRNTILTRALPLRS